MMVRMGVYGLVGIWSACCGRGNPHAWGDQEAVELCGQPCSSRDCYSIARVDSTLLPSICVIYGSLLYGTKANLKWSGTVAFAGHGNDDMRTIHQLLHRQLQKQIKNTM